MEDLVALYLYVCDCYDRKLCLHCQRMSNHFSYAFTDQEVITIFLYGILEQRFTLKSIHRFTQKYLSCWFPTLPSYQQFVYRVNLLEDVFAVMIEDLQSQASIEDFKVSLLDAYPIMMASAKRSEQAKVAKGLANKGYCASKSTYYYGVKLHVIATKRTHQLPFPQYIGLTPASTHDLEAVKEVIPKLEERQIFADKIYAQQQLQQQWKNQQNIQLLTPIRKKVNKQELSYSEQLFSTLVSKARQPIESLFSWLDEKTNLQKAHKVRSEKGLKVHVFGRIAAALILMIFPVFNS